MQEIGIARVVLRLRLRAFWGRPSDAIEKPASGCTADDLNAETWERNIECALGLLDRFGVINQGNLVRAIDPPKPALERGLRLT